MQQNGPPLTLIKCQNTKTHEKGRYQPLKRMIALLSACALVLTLSACGAKPQTQPKDYAKILTEARTEEENQYMSVVAKGEDGAPTLAHNPAGIEEGNVGDYVDLTLEMMGLTTEDLEDYAISASLINISAYNISILKPAQGKEADVVKALEAYRDLQMKSFENYLPDQYKITQDTQIKTLPTGEVVLVMCANADQVLTDLSARLAQ